MELFARAHQCQANADRPVWLAALLKDVDYLPILAHAGV